MGDRGGNPNQLPPLYFQQEVTTGATGTWNSEGEAIGWGQIGGPGVLSGPVGLRQEETRLILGVNMFPGSDAQNGWGQPTRVLAAAGPGEAEELALVAQGIGAAVGERAWQATTATLVPYAIDFSHALAEAHVAYRGSQFQRALEICAVIYPHQPNRTDLLLLIGAIYYQLGQFSVSIQFNDRCIIIDPNMAEAHANLANALQQLGNFDMAIVYYQSAIRLKPDFTDAYNNMASAYVQKGQIPEAIRCYQTALNLNQNLVDVYVNLGDLYRTQGNRDLAERAYSTALNYDSLCAAAWRGMGDLLRERGEYQEACTSYQEAIRLRPTYADAYTGMGAALKEMGQKQRAEACFLQVIRLRPHCALSHGNLAGVYYEQGKLQEAIATFKRALAIDNNFPEAYNNLGNALRENNQPEEAIKCYTTCIQLQCQRPAHSVAGRGVATNPTLAAQQHAQRLSVAYNNLGGILKMQGRAPEAIQCYEQVASLQSDSAEAHANLASAYKDAARQDQAISSYQKALSIRPEFPEAFANYVHSLCCVCEWKDRTQHFIRLEQEVRRDLAAGRLPPVQPFHAMAYPFPADLALAISAKYAEYCMVTAQRLNAPRLAHPPARPLRRGERLRIGYVSSDFGNHPLSHLMGSVFGLHDRSKVEVFCYALSASDNSEWRQRIEAEAEHFLDVSSWSTPAIASKISSDGIHIAINLNGYTKGARNEIFALLPAPVQTSYMGFPATTGAPFLPYLITDRIVAPTELAHCYSENLARMPNSYFVNDYMNAHMDVLDRANIPTREEVGLPADKIVYACSNQLYKYDPDTFQTWCNILQRVPDSVLWLLRFPPYGEPRIRKEAQMRGIASHRIIFTDIAQKPIHIRRSGLADVFIDTPMCNAHTTGCDVLWSGCPMVTYPLERMASRVAASLSHATGLGNEMVVNSQKEYEDLAVELGVNHQRRLDLRRRLEGARCTCALFDTQRWVRNLERVLFKMWEIHLEGKGPRPFDIYE
eukprot:jgi/Botrbrau1/18880/Bobra.177_2s0039.1